MVGQPRVLGEWDIGRAPKLDLVAPNDDLWAGTVDGLVTGAPFPFKWVQQLGGAARGGACWAELQCIGMESLGSLAGAAACCRLSSDAGGTG